METVFGLGGSKPGSENSGKKLLSKVGHGSIVVRRPRSYSKFLFWWDALSNPTFWTTMFNGRHISISDLGLDSCICNLSIATNICRHCKYIEHWTWLLLGQLNYCDSQGPRRVTVVKHAHTIIVMHIDSLWYFS